MNEQQHLLNTIWNDEPDLLAKSGFDIRGISIYRRNLLANAQRALSITFPTVFQLLDSDNFENISQQFLKHSPPTHGDWAQWGRDLADYIATTDTGRDYPYLSDCTNLDWHIHRALHGCDQTIQRASLQLLVDVEPKNITVEFNKNMTLISTENPIAEIFQAHHHSDETQRDASMNKAKKALSQAPEKNTVMISRPDFQPKVTRLNHDDAEFILNLKSGCSLATSLDAISPSSNFSFQQWLLAAIKNNLIYYFKEN